MNRFVPYGKLSKKKQRELNREKRGTWGALNPVTRCAPNPGAYSRAKEKAACRKADRYFYIF